MATESSGKGAIVAVAVIGALVGAGLGYGIAAGLRGGPPGGGPGGPGKGGGGEGPPPAGVRVAEVEAPKLRVRFAAIGRLEAVRRSVLTAEATGTLRELAVDVGDALDGGETVIGRIDDVWARLELAAAEAELAGAEATLDQARRDLAQLEQLLANESAKPKEVKDARARAKAERAALAAAEARKRRARVRLERTRIDAPFDARVTRKHAEVGEWLVPGDPVVEVVSRGAVDARVFVPENRINAVARGDEVSVLVEPLGERVRGPIVAIDPSGRNRARTFVVEVRLDAGGGALKPGMSVEARLPTGRKARQLTVPRRAVSFSPHGAAVWIAASQGGGPPMARAVPVEVLFGTGDRYAVAPQAAPSPLEAGARVVIEGWERLAPGRPVKVVNGPPGAEGRKREKGARRAP